MSNKRKIRRVEEGLNWGIYAWKALVKGKYVWLKDEDGNVLSIASSRNNPEAQKKLQEAASHYGYGIGKAVFLEGCRKISQEEWEHQKAREAAGLVPDPMDFEAIKEEQEYIKHHGT